MRDAKSESSPVLDYLYQSQSIDRAPHLVASSMGMMATVFEGHGALFRKTKCQKRNDIVINSKT